MTTILCDECGGKTVPDMAVFERVRHYADPARWVALIQRCQPCAIIYGWGQGTPPNPFMSTAAQFDAWLQLASR